MQQCDRLKIHYCMIYVLMLLIVCTASQTVHKNVSIVSHCDRSKTRYRARRSQSTGEQSKRFQLQVQAYKQLVWNNWIV